MEETTAGQLALYQTLKMSGPQPYTLSYIGKSGTRRRTVVENRSTREYHPASARIDSSLLENLRFAFKHEALDLRIVHTALNEIGPQDIRRWVQDEPFGRYSRLAWFYYEKLNGTSLDLPPVANALFVDALDPKRHFTASPIKSARHHVNDNLLGDGNLCPTLRRTAKLEDAIKLNLSSRAREIASHYAPEMLRRATDYLYTRETRSSFDIEGETPDNMRAERFLQSLRKADEFDPTSKAAYITLQRSILEDRFAADDWRTDQIYVGTRKQRGGEHVHYIGPKPADVPPLMDGLFKLAQRGLESTGLDPVLAAAAISFAFVFIHPFDDGNGRTHRFLIHNILTRRGFTPGGMIFPVSASILRDKDQYHKTLDQFSQPLRPCIDWIFYGDDEIEVRNETRNLYRFFDATHLAEYLYDRVEDTIRVDFQEELDYLSRYDAAFTAVQNIVDMPDRDISLMVRLCLQNEGWLSNNKRDRFPRLRDDEITRMEQAIQAIMLPEKPR